MPEKETGMRGKREALINAALELFIEKGYEGTVIRSITRKAGCEVGLFYYYFKSKDEVFDLAISRFIENYRPGFEELLREGRENPKQLLSSFFSYVAELAEQFRVKYEPQMHWTVRQAIHRQTLELMKSYLEQGLQIMLDEGLPKPSIALPVLVTILAHGIGNVVIYMDRDDYAANFLELKKAVYLLLGSPENAPEEILKLVK